MSDAQPPDHAVPRTLEGALVVIERQRAHITEQAATIAALTIYDMCKALSHDIVIGETRLISKSGGKSDYSRGNST